MDAKRTRETIALRKRIIAVFSRNALERLSTYERPHLCDINTLRSAIIMQWPIDDIVNELEKVARNA